MKEDHYLQRFMLKLGKGFAFVASQKHIRTEQKDTFIDLVFYNYILIRKAGISYSAHEALEVLS